MISKIILGILAAIVVFVLYQKLTAVRITGTDARSLVADGAVLVDVRSTGEFSGGHIEGALNIPIQELSGRIGELGDKSGPIVLYCQSGSRSLMAKRLLEKNGFTDVHDMGGMSHW
ncbi:MAG: rhodanese-like domain-containing protein [Polyangiales bacterium]